MKNFGYLLIVNNDKDNLYHRMAHVLASSIKKTQPKNYDNVCLITDRKDLSDSGYVFDKIIFNDDYVGWDQRNYMDKLTPYKHTICLDVDMVFTRDISHWVDYFVSDPNGLHITKNVLKYNGDKLTNLKCRPGYVENNIPILYSGFTYFSKESKIVPKFFKLVHAITENKTTFKNLYMSKNSPKEIGTDEAFSIASHILDIDYLELSFPRFVHLKSELQDYGLQSISRDLGYYLDSSANITIGNYAQYDIIHYSEKDFPISNIQQVYKELFLKGIKHV